jgi:hypothetical protein
MKASRASRHRGGQRLTKKRSSKAKLSIDKENPPASISDREVHIRRQGELMAKSVTQGHPPKPEEERERRWFREGIPVLITKEFSDPENGDPRPMAALNGQANRDIQELARQIRCCCADKKWTGYQKRVACEELVKLAVLSTQSIARLAGEFPQPFREIAEELPWFPCLFPARADDLRSLQEIIWNEFNLAKRHPLKSYGLGSVSVVWSEWRGWTSPAVSLSQPNL